MQRDLKQERETCRLTLKPQKNEIDVSRLKATDALICRRAISAAKVHNDGAECRHIPGYPELKSRGVASRHARDVTKTTGYPSFPGNHETKVAGSLTSNLFTRQRIIRSS